MLLQIKYIKGEIALENIKIFACPTAEEFAQKVCNHLGLPLGRMECFKFKNDNTFVKVTIKDIEYPYCIAE